MRRRWPTAAMLAASVLAVLFISGCSAPNKLSADRWPPASTEPTVVIPADLLRWPLTGEKAPSDAAIHSRVVSVKIENSPAARPWTGLGGADVVYETLTEGGITRFNAIYQSRSLPTVGPVRSARLSDLEIVPQYGALFAHVGGNTPVMAAIKSSGIQDLDQFFNPRAYWRSSSRPAPHNMFTSIAGLRKAGLARGYPARQDVRPFLFRALGSSGASSAPVGSVTVPFAPQEQVTWSLDRRARAWVRADNGRVYRDTADGEVLARNVVVLWTRVTATEKRDKNGVATLDIGLRGSGRATVFRGDGIRLDGTWSAEGASPLVLKDSQGDAIPLAPGTTWFEVIPNDLDITMR
jgi:hypothetical protein